MLMCKSSRQFCMTAVICAWADMINNVCTITVFFKWVLSDVNRREHHILKVPCWIRDWYILHVWCRCSVALVRSKADIYGTSYIWGCVCVGLMYFPPCHTTVLFLPLTDDFGETTREVLSQYPPTLHKQSVCVCVCINCTVTRRDASKSLYNAKVFDHVVTNLNDRFRLCTWRLFTPGILTNQNRKRWSGDY